VVKSFPFFLGNLVIIQEKEYCDQIFLFHLAKSHTKKSHFSLSFFQIPFLLFPFTMFPFLPSLYPFISNFFLFHLKMAYGHPFFLLAFIFVQGTYFRFDIEGLFFLNHLEFQKMYGN
jgi:hypothetical protein